MDAGSRVPEGTQPVTAQGSMAPETVLQGVLEDIARDLNTSVIRCSFEASLLLASALRFVSDHEASDRIGAAIDLLDENIRQVQTLVFGFGLHNGAGDTT
jgi:hypothetical protein